MDHNSSLSLHDQRGRAPPPYHAALHSMQKPPAKPWRKPDQSTPPPKVYRVDPRDFRQLVQQLTGAARPVARPLRDTAPPPPPLKLAAQPMQSFSPLPPPVMDGGDHGKSSGVSGGQSPTGFLELLSPSLYSSWCSFPLLSPAGPVGSMEYI